MNLSLGERIKKSRENAGFSLDKLCELINVAKRTLQNYEKNVKEPTVSTVINIAKKCHINESWLLTGEGEMFLNKSNMKDERINENILEDKQGINFNDELKKELQEDIFSINLPKNVSNYAIQIWQSDEKFKSRFTTIEDFLSFVMKIAIKNLTIGDKKENQAPAPRRTFDKDTFEKKFEIKEEIKLDNQTYLKVYDIEEIEENKKSKVKTRIAKAYFFTIKEKDGENIYQETSAIPLSKAQKELDSK